MSHAADAATGQTIHPGEAIVAIVLDRRTGGYPNAATHAAIPALAPAAMFEPVSLPLHGTYREFGTIAPTPGQPALAQVLALAAQPDWERFQDKAFGVRGGVVIGKAAHGTSDPVLDDPDGPRERVLGLAIFRKETWDVAVGASGLTDRAGDVDAVIACMAKVRAMSKAGDNDGSMRNSGVLSLTQGGFRGSDGRREELPDLARALAHREGGDLMGNVAVEWMTEGPAAPLGYGLLDRDADASTRSVVDAIWELGAAENGMKVLGRIWTPSPMSLYRSEPETFALGLSMIEGTGRRMVAACEDFPENEVGTRLEELLAKVEEVRASLIADLAKVRGDDYEGDGGPAFGR